MKFLQFSPLDTAKLERRFRRFLINTVLRSTESGKGYSSSSVTLAYWARRAAFLCFSSWDTSFGFTTILACFSIMLAMAWISSGKETSQSVSQPLQPSPGCQMPHAAASHTRSPQKAPSHCHRLRPTVTGSVPAAGRQMSLGTSAPSGREKSHPKNIPHPPPRSLLARSLVVSSVHRAQQTSQIWEFSLRTEGAGAAEEPPRRWLRPALRLMR